jgi:hypothetical protein
MFGFPTQMVSLSSPCQVTCTPLSTAIESGLNTNATIADLSFCNTANFSTTNIQNCVFCYGLMDQQKYLANCMPVRIFTSIRILTDYRRISSPPSPRHCLSRPTHFYQPISCRRFIHLQLNHDSTTYNLFGRHVRVTTPSWHVVGPRHCPSRCLRLPPPSLDVHRLLLLCAPTTS